jgi:hypothetical protein
MTDRDPIVVEDDAVNTIPVARPGFRWPVAASTVIAANRNDVWNVISSPGLVPLYHPFCETNPVDEWPGPGSHDEIHYFSGLVLERRFTNWFEDVGYDLEIARPGGRTSTVSWRLDERDGRRTTVRITVYPHTLQHQPVVIRWLPHFIMLRPRLRRYLKSVVTGLDWFITRGQPVQRNQFGAHRWFSPPIPGGQRGG